MLEQTGLALALDARAGLDRDALRECLQQLADPARQARMAAAGPRAIDGDGARQAAAALVGRWGFER